MSLVLILLLGLLIGAVLGGLGGGGAILTVPALVYVIGQSAKEATASSLIIVGITALTGMASYVSTKRVRWVLGLTFGVVGFPATYAGSYLNHRVNENVLLLGFSCLMLLASAAMILDRTGKAQREDTSDDSPHTGTTETPRSGATRPDGQRTAVLERTDVSTVEAPYPSFAAVIAVALAVGLLTGFFGVGGGFVIVPALVLVLRVPMKWAVGTSLLIVALNSATSLAARAGSAHFDWSVIIPFTLAAMAASFSGKQVADRLPARRLKVGFAVLLIGVALYTGGQSLHGLVASTQHQSAAPHTGATSTSKLGITRLAGARTRSIETLLTH